MNDTTQTEGVSGEQSVDHNLIRIDSKLLIPLTLQATYHNRQLHDHINYILEQYIRADERHADIFEEVYGPEAGK